MNLSMLRRAAQARKSLEMFEYNCSHVLSSPLQSIQGLLNLLEKETDPVTIDTCFQMISQATSNLDVIIKELDQCVKATEGELQISCLDFEAMIREILKQVDHPLQANSVRPSLIIKQEESFYSDASRLSTILTQLISNAITFSDADKDIRLLVICISVEAGVCTIRIGDNGCGIPAATKLKIFQPFFRGSEKSTGPGLGLFIVAETISKIEATITVDSKPGQGSVFTIKLPSLQK